MNTFNDERERITKGRNQTYKKFYDTCPLDMILQQIRFKAARAANIPINESTVKVLAEEMMDLANYAEKVHERLTKKINLPRTSCKGG